MNMENARYTYSVIVPVAVAHRAMDRLGPDAFAEVRYEGESVELRSAEPIRLTASDYADDRN
jgi:hypothetical protein